jgi:hypothetical protein
LSRSSGASARRAIKLDPPGIELELADIYAARG